ncbi:MAG: hypothetical protein K1Y36_12500 [Blastocatellia bacterium]|nr:hypothetical protein [Blastocatellia bacterium]
MHLLAMVLFAFFVSAVFAGISGDIRHPKKCLFYGMRVFASFVGIGMVIAWLMYLFP